MKFLELFWTKILYLEKLIIAYYPESIQYYRKVQSIFNTKMNINSSLQFGNSKSEKWKHDFKYKNHSKSNFGCSKMNCAHYYSHVFMSSFRISV